MAAPPDDLSEVAKAQWRRMYGPLRNCGLLTVADLPALEAYCVHHALWHEAREKLKTEPRVATSKSGYQQASPWFTILTRNAELMLRIMSGLGMMPSARTRTMAVGPPAPKSDQTQTDEPAPEAGEFTGLIGRQPH